MVFFLEWKYAKFSRWHLRAQSLREVLRTQLARITLVFGSFGEWINLVFNPA
jgi:hypothetical protein